MMDDLGGYKLYVPPGADRDLVVPPDVQDEREAAKVAEEAAEAEKPVVRLGICKGQRTSSSGVSYRCGAYTQLWKPADLCERCLLAQAKEKGLIE